MPTDQTTFRCPTTGRRPLEVHKFGGSSLADADRLGTVADLVITARAQSDVVVVCSAMGGTTDRLARFVDSPGERGALERSGAIDEIRSLHLETLGALGLGSEADRAPALALLEELAAIDGALAYLHRTPGALRDRAQSIGERLSVEILAGLLRARGCDAVAMHASGFLETTAPFGAADPTTFRSDRRARAALTNELDAGRAPIVTGFFGRGPDGDIRLLGRGGSDLTASLLASALGAESLVIWTDVEGVFSCDPRLVPESEHIAHLHYREAGEMAYFGSKVLHPRTMIPVIDKQIPVVVRSTLKPDGRSTRIDGSLGARAARQVAVSVIGGVTLLSLEGAGMAGVVGVSARLFGALARARVSVVMIEQGSSEASICFAVHDEDALAAAHAVREEFRLDVARGVIEQLATRSNMAIITAVGSGLRRRIGSLSAMTHALASAGVNIHAITQGSSELSISVAVDARDARRAARAVHAASRSGSVRARGAAPGVAVALIGLGGVGRAVARQVAAHTNHRVVALADSSGFISEPAGMDPERINTICDAKAAGRPLAAHLGGVTGSARGLLDLLCDDAVVNLSLIDCTASAEMTPIAIEALSRGVHVVTANKQIVACPAEQRRALRDAAGRGRTFIGLEATVGAGLPVAVTIAELINAGDEIRGIEAALSGSVGFVLAELEEGRRLGETITRAIELGYAEPDPSDDLHGLDLGRKALILARLCGFGADDTVEIERLVSLADDGSVSASAEERLRTRIDQAHRAGRRLRYLATVGPDAPPRVALCEVDATHPFFDVPPRRAAIAIRTRMQGDDPIMITGPGAGADPTAGGVLADLGRIASRIRGGSVL